MLGGGVQAGFAVASIAGGLGLLGTAGRVLDPFSMAAGGFRAASGMGLAGRVAMGAAGAAIPLAIGYGISHIANSAVTGAQEQASIEQVLSRQQFQNPNSRTGRGFSRQDSMQIGNMVRDLAQVPEMLTSVGELTKIMDKMGSMGLLNSAHDATSFQKKFKEILGTIKDVARAMGTTLDDAAAALGEARKSGIYSQNDVVRNALNRQVTAGLTGMNQQQVGQLRSIGSQMGFATGGSRKTGAENIQRMADQLGIMNKTGKLSDDRIAELTGKEGPEGIQALAAHLADANYAASQSSLGTAMTAALAEIKDGRFTGKMDQKLVDENKANPFSEERLMGMAKKNLASKAGQASFKAQEEALRSEMAGAVGIDGQMAQMRKLLRGHGYDSADIDSIVAQKFHVDPREAGLIADMGKQNFSGEIKDLQDREGNRAKRNTYIAENFSIDAIKKKLETKISNKVTEPFKELGVGIRDYFSNLTDQVVDDLTGHYATQLSTGVSDLVRDMAQKKDGAAKSLQSLLNIGQRSGQSKFLSDSKKDGFFSERTLAKGLGGVIGVGESGQIALVKELGLGGLIGNATTDEAVAKIKKHAQDVETRGTDKYRIGAEKEYDAAKRQLTELLNGVSPDDISGANRKSSETRLNEIVNKVKSTERSTGFFRKVGFSSDATGDNGSALEILAKKKGVSVTQLVAEMSSGDKDIKRMDSAPKLSDIASSMDGLGGTLADLAKDRKRMERDLGRNRSFGVVQDTLHTGALLNASSSSGGDSALKHILNATKEQRQEMLTAISSGDYSKVAKYGITAENAVEARRLLQTTDNSSDSEKKDLLKYVGTVAKETKLGMDENLKDRAVTFRNLSKSSSDSKMRSLLGSLSDKMEKGSTEDIDSELGAIVKHLSDPKLKEKDRRKLETELRDSRGGSEILEAEAEYGVKTHGGRDRGKQAEEALTSVVKTIESKLLGGDTKTKEGSTFASEAAIKQYFEQLNANNTQIATMLGNIGAGRPIGAHEAPMSVQP